MGLFKSISRSLGLSKDPTFGGVPVPPTIRPRQMVNEMLGISVEEEEITLPDGTKEKRLVTRNQLSPEQEERLNLMERQYDQLLLDYNELSELSAAIDSEVFSPVIEAQRANQKDARERAFRERANLEEEQLAKRGIADSTSAVEVRNARGSDLVDQAVQDERDLTLLAEDLRNSQLQRTERNLGFLEDVSRNRVNQGNVEAQRQLNFFNQENADRLSTYDRQFQNEQAIFNSNLAATQSQDARLRGTISQLATGFSTGFGQSISPLSTQNSPLNRTITWNSGLNYTPIR